MDEEKYLEKLKNLLVNSLKESVKSIGSEKIALAFSGGLDSSILAKLLKEIGIKQTAYVVGIENCKDFESAEKSAKELGLELKKIVLTKEEIEKSMAIQTKILQKIYEQHKNRPESESHPLKPTSVSVSFTLPIFFVAKYSKEKYIINGQGADTMFAGFEKYLKLTEEQAIEKIKKDTKDLVEIGSLQFEETASYFKKRVLMPFLSPDLVNFCLSLPYELKIKNSERKYILRKLAKKIGLSDEIAFKKKKSAQYGTEIMKVMKKIAKENNILLSEYIINC